MKIREKYCASSNLRNVIVILLENLSITSYGLVINNVHVIMSKFEFSTVFFFFYITTYISSHNFFE